MKYLIFSMLSLTSLHIFADNMFDVEKENIKYADSEVVSAGYIQKLWKNDDVYYEKDEKGRTGFWSGDIYRYSVKNCYKVSIIYDVPNIDFTDPVSWKKVDCKNDFKKRALADELPTFPSIQAYLEEVWKCLNKNDEKCLRPYISRAVKVRVDAIDFSDQRDEFFKIWSIEELKDKFPKPTAELKSNSIVRRNNGKFMVTSLVPPIE